MSLLGQLLRRLVQTPRSIKSPLAKEADLLALGHSLARESHRRLGRSLALREVDAGSCNGCELELQAACGPDYDLERFGIRFVASPRHADALLITGPMTENMVEATLRAWDAVPEPKWIVAMGDCAIYGGVFAGSYAVKDGVAPVLPVDLTIPGCPPEPEAILSGLLALLETVAQKKR